MYTIQVNMQAHYTSTLYLQSTFTIVYYASKYTNTIHKYIYKNIVLCYVNCNTITNCIQLTSTICKLHLSGVITLRTIHKIPTLWHVFAPEDVIDCPSKVYFSQKQLPRKMKLRLVIIDCAGYIFWQLFL